MRRQSLWRWWHLEGDYPPEDEHALHPAPHSVLDAYRKAAKVSFTILSEETKISEQMLRRIFHQGAGLDSIKRRRSFARRFSVPPDLLGLAALHFLEHSDGKPWWVKEGYPPFNRDGDGYPNPQEVVRWGRQQKMKALRNGKHIPWSQYDLGQACDPPLSQKSVNKLETHGTGLDSINRRRAFAFLLGLPPALLGLDGAEHQETGLVLPTFTLALPPKAVNADSLSIYKQRQADLFTEYYTHPPRAQSAAGEAEGWITYLRENLLPLARNDEQYVALLSLEQGYHRFIANITREQRKDDIALIHANAAVTVAEEMADLEYLIKGLHTRAFNLQELGSHETAQKDIDRALQLIQQAEQEKRRIPTVLHGTVLLRAGLIHTRTAQLESEHAVAQSMFKQALRLAKQAGEEEDPHMLKLDPAYVHLGMAQALTTQYHPVTLKEHLDEATKLTDPALQRRHLLIQVCRARGELLKAKHSSGLKQDQYYAEATLLATEALTLAKQLQSRLNRDRIQYIYQELRESPYRDEPAVARLGLMLLKW